MRCWAAGGRDLLIGGAESDSFCFTSATDSGPYLETRDTILDFQDNLDRIDLRFIDAKVGSSSDDVFAFIGTTWPSPASPVSFGLSGQPRAQKLEGDTDGDRDADFSVGIMDAVHTVQLGVATSCLTLVPRAARSHARTSPPHSNSHCSGPTMTNYTITPSNSRHTTNPSQHAFERDSSGPDALVVQEGAFLTASGISAFGARLAGTGAWTVRIDGSVVSQKSAGLVLDAALQPDPQSSSVRTGPLAAKLA
jgi:hypothetical protein